MKGLHFRERLCGFTNAGQQPLFHTEHNTSVDGFGDFFFSSGYAYIFTACVQKEDENY